jgi:hypothetical protein
MDEQQPETPPESGEPTPPDTPPPGSGDMPPAAPPAPGDLPSMPSPGPEWGAQPVETPMPMGEPPKKSNTSLFVGIGVLAIAVIAAVAFFALKKSGPGGFPETLGGVARNHSSQAQQIENEAQQQSFAGMTITVAVYGSDTSPSHIAMLFHNVPDSIKGQSLAPFLDQLASGFSGSGAGSVDTSQALSQSIGGVEYLCLPMSVSGQGGAMCVFNGDQLGAVLTLTTSDPHSALTLAQQVSDSVQ